MLLKTYDKILDLFHRNHGYMGFRQMKDLGVTELQIQELKKRGVLECYARGFYWCGICGYEKPTDYKYVEIGHAYPNAVICMDSAAYLQGLIKKEPETVSIATTRENRQKVGIYFPVHRYYFQNVGDKKEVDVIHTRFGDYKVYGKERTTCDCIRMARNLEQDVVPEIITSLNPTQKQIDRVMAYAKELRALKPVQAAFRDVVPRK